MDFIKQHLKGDIWIWATVIILAAISILTVYSCSQVLVGRFEGTAESYALKHAFFLSLGLITIFLVHRMDYNLFSKGAKWLLLGSVPVLIGTLFFGRSGRWIDFPGFSLQPSEIAKLALIMYLASVISKKQSTIKSLKDGFYPILLPVIGICALIFPSDLSTAALIFLTSLIMMFIGRTPFKYIFALVSASLVGVTFFVFLLLNLPDEFLVLRTDIWKDRLVEYGGSINEHKVGFQQEQAYIAIIHGRLGLGPGKSVQRNLLPEAYSDYIYAIVIEEYGPIGMLTIIGLYLFLFYRCLLIFRRSPGTFGALLAISLAISLVAQAFLNLMVTVGLLPVTGVTLPFISRGGTSIIVTSLAIGVILSVDFYNQKGRKKPKRRPKKRKDTDKDKKDKGPKPPKGEKATEKKPKQKAYQNNRIDISKI